MRPFIQRTAGATFTCGSSLSLIFRKDYIEYVFKLQGDFYGIIHLIPAADGQMLFADWGGLFPTHHRAQRTGKADAYVGETLSESHRSDDGCLR